MLRKLVCGLTLAAGGLAAGCEYPGSQGSTYGKNAAGGKAATEPTAADRSKEEVIAAANGLIRQIHQRMSVLPDDDAKKQKYDALVKLKNDALEVDADKFDAIGKKLKAATEEMTKLAGGGGPPGGGMGNGRGGPPPGGGRGGPPGGGD